MIRTDFITEDRIRGRVTILVIALLKALILI